MSYYGYPKYVSVEEKKAKAEKALKKLKKNNPGLEPVIIEGRTLARSWWGKAWNLNLESYADYSNRIARGKSYVRSNAVLDLKLSKGRVTAMVQGSRAKPYDTEIWIDTLNSTKWREISELCNHRIDTLEQLIEGNFPRKWRFCSRIKGILCFHLRRKSILTVAVLITQLCANMWRQYCMVSVPDWIRIRCCFSNSEISMEEN
ncbi:hypothetical protein N752_16200 [Desulforamulus aquiferis]|nr:hypothetical protein N752_16200 [Desulforamulus aquiferis]